MNNILIIICLISSFISYGQYPFEKYSAIKYKEYKDWKVDENSKKDKGLQFTIAVPKFFNHKDTLTVELTSFNFHDSSYITVFRNQKEIQRFFEPMDFSLLNVVEPLRLADINGDHLTDLKLIVNYMGNGIGALYTRVIYLFQHPDNKFIKISYRDMMNENRPERDFNNVGNFEIITMSLLGYQDHNYWSFNLFNFRNNDLISVDQKYDYPILIQCLLRENHKITNKLTRAKMKEFALKKPEDYDKQQ
jgi:hypothetical protein